MYAVIETGGKQYKVQEGSTVYVEKLENELSTTVEFDKVLLVAGEGEPLIGAPYVENAKVVGTYIDIIKDDKVIIYKFKRKTGYDKKQGHRQKLAQVKIESIQTGTSVKKAAAKKEVAEVSEEISNTTENTEKKPAKKTTSTSKSTGAKKQVKKEEE